MPQGGGILYAVETWSLRKMLERFGNPPLCVGLWTGEVLTTSSAPPVARIVIRDRATLRKLLRSPSIAFGDGYSAGAIEVEGNLAGCMETLFRAMRKAGATPSVGRMLWERITSRRPHTIDASRESVHHHYDIGNDFYKLWLDEQLVYTCAYFSDPAMTLEQAQVAKMHHVCRKLQLAAGQTVVEAGCGWGSLALHMACHYGVKVRAFNLSHEQIAYARERALATGLSDRVEFVEDDYRNITGKYDAFVSVGMLEHVGPENYRELGRVIDRALTPKGRGLIHSIGRNAACPMDPWTEKRIFPGAHPPSLREMMDIFEPCGFSVLDIENLRLHYARTLEHWLSRFETVTGSVAEMFDEQFVRAWRFYLASSMAVFLCGDLQLFQVLFARGDDNNVPWTRDYMYPTVKAEGEPRM